MAEIIDHDETVEVRNRNVSDRTDEDGNRDWAATLTTPYGFVATSGWRYASWSGVSYQAIVGGRLRTRYERGRFRTPTGAARVAHKWIKALHEEASRTPGARESDELLVAMYEGEVPPMSPITARLVLRATRAAWSSAWRRSEC